LKSNILKFTQWLPFHLVTKIWKLCCKITPCFCMVMASWQFWCTIYLNK